MDPVPSDLAAASGRLGLWLGAVRPRTLSISIAPILAALAHAGASDRPIAWVPVAAATVAALAIQITANLANDAGDGEKGHDGPHRLGPIRVTASGLMSAGEVRRGALVASIVAALAGLVAVAHGGVPILLVGLASIAAAWAYSGGPRPIAATPFGEVFVLVCFGVVAVAGTEWLAIGEATLASVPIGLAVGLPAAAVLTVNNHRDRVEDEANGRRTLAIVLGERRTAGLYALETVGAVILAGAVAPDFAGTALVATAALPALMLAERFARAPIGRGLNALLGLTAAFQMLLVVLFALVFAAGSV